MESHSLKRKASKLQHVRKALLLRPQTGNFCALRHLLSRLPLVTERSSRCFKKPLFATLSAKKPPSLNGVLLFLNGARASEEETSTRRLTLSAPKTRRPLRPNNIRNTIKKIPENVLEQQQSKDPSPYSSTTSSGTTGIHRLSSSTRKTSNTVDYLARNTVPVASVTESSRKPSKLRPSPDHMLAYQAISSTERGGSGEPLNSATGWALASLGPPKNSTSKRIISSQTPKPFNSYWSTRLNKIRPTTPSTQFDAPKPASRECNGTCSETPTENFIQKESENESSLRPNTPVKSTDISLPEPTLRTNELNRKVTRVPPLFKKIDNSTEDRPLSYAANSIPIIGNNLLKEAKSGDLGSSILNGVLATSVYKYVDRTANEETGSTLEKSQPTTERPKITGDCNTTTSSSVNGNVSVSEPTPVINYTTTLATGRIETSSRNDSESSTQPTVMTLLPTESASDPGASSAPSIKTTTNAEIAIESLLKSTEGSVDVSLETHKSAESTTGTSYNSDHTLPNTSETPTMSVGVSSSTVSSERISRVNVTESSVMNATTPLTESSSSSTDLPEEPIPTEPLTNSSIPKLNTTAVHQASTTTSTTEPTPTPTAATVITVASVRSDSPPAMNVSEIPTTTSPQTTLPLEANDIPEAITLLKPLSKQNHSSTSPAPATTPSIENLTEKSPLNYSVQNQTHAIGSVTTVEPKEPSTAKASTPASRNVEVPSDQTTMESTTRHVELDENRILPGSVTTLKPSSPVTEAAKEKDTPDHLETTISADEVDVSYSSDDTPAKDVPDRTTLPPITVLPSSVPTPVEVTTVKQVTKWMVNSSTEKYNTSTSIFDLDEKKRRRR
ncbi:unnamed protein product [Nesidiocoris tenuis]|uniref:Uncharacterized protein n=1 Tax=Nesidiocoris tenuis TaxID=355587 RepID=A0A6H5GJZ6_9HEMI|nr:unnamed protein product [Nesidiocoris tenuis]